MSGFCNFVYSQDPLRGEIVFHKITREKGDCLPGGFVFELPNKTYPKILKIKRLGELKIIWDNWTVERQNAVTTKYCDIALLLPIEVDEQLLKATIFFGTRLIGVSPSIMRT